MPELFKAPAKKTTKAAATKPPSRGGTLSAFMVRPNGIRFETQEATEEILLLMRQHPVTQVGWALATIGLFLLPGLIVPLLLGLGLGGFELPPGYFVVLPLLWYLGVFGFAFTNFLHWYFNIYIVTSERVVDIDWVNLLYKKLSSTQLEKIQDVSYKQGGILDSFFDFGTVYIQTAGNEPNFEFEEVPKPDHVVREINRIIEIETEGRRQ